MSRIDVKTLVLAFENRIAALDKNPPEVVPQKTISLLLENALQEEIQNHFYHLIKKDVKEVLQKEFKKQKTKLVTEVVKRMLNDESFKQSLMKNIQGLLIHNITK
jgi:hypothetical protein